MICKFNSAALCLCSALETEKRTERREPNKRDEQCWFDRHVSRVYVQYNRREARPGMYTHKHTHKKGGEEERRGEEIKRETEEEKDRENDLRVCSPGFQMFFMHGKDLFRLVDSATG